ncbi:hypothetical protein D5S18_01740 [Nocardia panacis]|uniref:Uncharacterized protein n=1 Tax=Nocardia panacis TaxID=2340916 RepID=A0A3A4KQJ7_9NOCA|nr:hypothetical protein D5S18_01740 [Nocardia panacis]
MNAATRVASNSPRIQLSNSPRHQVFPILARAVAWVIFLGGLVGAVLGLVGLRVEITVAGLILACTTGLILLKLRAEYHLAEPA